MSLKKPVPQFCNIMWFWSESLFLQSADTSKVRCQQGYSHCSKCFQVSNSLCVRCSWHTNTWSYQLLYVIWSWELTAPAFCFKLIFPNKTLRQSLWTSYEFNLVFGLRCQDLCPRWPLWSENPATTTVTRDWSWVFLSMGWAGTAQLWLIISIWRMGYEGQRLRVRPLTCMLGKLCWEISDTPCTNCFCAPWNCSKAWLEILMITHHLYQ